MSQRSCETFYILGPPGTSGVEVTDEPISDDDNAGSAGQRRGIRKGVKFVDHGKRTEVPQQDRLPKRSDANWLLVEFLIQGVCSEQHRGSSSLALLIM